MLTLEELRAELERPRFLYYSSKMYDIGLSCAFRQPFAKSHCAKLHGYDLKFEIMFEADTLDNNYWVIDFGALKPVKTMLEDMFDHTTVLAENDPALEEFRLLEDKGLVDIRVLPHVGVEKFAEFVYAWVDSWLVNEGHSPRVRVKYVRCWERDANSGAYGRL